MTIKEFCDEYNKLATQLQDKYITDNVKIKKYVPFLTKVTYAENLARVSMVDHESGNIHVNSAAGYLQFPADELAEFNTLCDMAKSDVMTNKATTRAFIESQIDRFAMLTSGVIAPMLESVKDTIANLDDVKVKKWIKPIVTAINKQNKNA